MGIAKLGGTIDGVVAGVTRAGVVAGVTRTGVGVGDAAGAITVGGSKSISIASTGGVKAVLRGLANDTCFSTAAGTIEGVTGVTGIFVMVGSGVAGVVVIAVTGVAVKVGATKVFAFVVAIGGSFSCLFSGGFISFGASNCLGEHGTEGTCSIGPR